MPPAIETPSTSSSFLATLPALIVSSSDERFQHAAVRLGAHGFSPISHVPAVYVNATNRCRGTEGHRLAMRSAFRIIVDTNTSMAVFEDDAEPASMGRHLNAAVLAAKIQAFIRHHAPSNDVLWLGGMGRVGMCKPNEHDRIGLPCAPIQIPFNSHYHPKVFGWNSYTARRFARIEASSSFFTDHAKWISPRGAAIMLGCTSKCLESPGSGIDSIEKSICVDEGRRNSSHAMTVSLVAGRRRYCDAGWQRMTPDTELRCVRPPSEYWLPMPSERATIDMRPKIFLGYFWQTRSRTNASLLQQMRIQEAVPRGRRQGTGQL